MRCVLLVVCRLLFVVFVVLLGLLSFFDVLFAALVAVSCWLPFVAYRCRLALRVVWMFVVRCLLFVRCCLVLVVCCLSTAMPCVLFAGGCLLCAFVGCLSVCAFVCCAVCVGRCLRLSVCCVLCVVCDVLIVDG